MDIHWWWSEYKDACVALRGTAGRGVCSVSESLITLCHRNPLSAELQNLRVYVFCSSFRLTLVSCLRNKSPLSILKFLNTWDAVNQILGVYLLFADTALDSNRDCPVTGNTVPLLLSDKQQHIVGQLSRGEEGEGGGKDQSSSPQVSLKIITDLENCHLGAVGRSQICKRTIT